MKAIFMRWKWRLLIVAVVIFLLWFGVNIILPAVWLRHTQNQVNLLNAISQSMRNAYLNDLFLNPDSGNPSNNCWQCYLRLIGALDAIKQAAEKNQSSFSFDYAKLVPLIRVGTTEFDEPIPAKACHLILQKHDARVFNVMVKYYKNDSKSFDWCIMNGAKQFHELWPQSYPALKNSLMQVPELLPLLKELP